MAICHDNAEIAFNDESMLQVHMQITKMMQSSIIVFQAETSKLLDCINGRKSTW
ncbi:unnamed protein product, partial [Linum tenue]